MGSLASLKGHTLDLEVAICCHVVDSLHVEAVGKLELMPIWQPDGQVSLLKGDAHLVDREDQRVTPRSISEPG